MIYAAAIRAADAADWLPAGRVAIEIGKLVSRR
jgi:hypothetical protein